MKRKKKFSNDYWMNPGQKYVEVEWHKKQQEELKELYENKLKNRDAQLKEIARQMSEIRRYALGIMNRVEESFAEHK